MKKTTEGTGKSCRHCNKRRQGAGIFHIAALCTLLIMLAACDRICPTTLDALANWYETDEFSGFRSITMEATFTNDTGDAITFASGDTFSLWLKVGDKVKDAPVTIHKAPPASVAAGENFTYKLTVHALAYVFTPTKIAFRGFCVEHGTLSPAQMSLVDATFTCR